MPSFQWIQFWGLSNYELIMCFHARLPGGESTFKTLKSCLLCVDIPWVKCLSVPYQMAQQAKNIPMNMIRYTDCIQNKLKKAASVQRKNFGELLLKSTFNMLQESLARWKKSRNKWVVAFTHHCNKNTDGIQECELITSVSWELVLYCSLHLQRQSWSSSSNGTHKLTPSLINHIKTTQSKDASRPAAKPHCQMTGSATGWRKQSHSHIFVFVLSADQRTDTISL